MLAKRLIKSNDAGGGACTNTVDLYNPFPDGGGVALYQLNGDATDVSGNYDGTATNVTYGAGQFGQAASFNTSNSILTAPVAFSTNSPYSVSAWVKIANGSTTQSCKLFWKIVGTEQSALQVFYNGDVGSYYFSVTHKFETNQGFGYSFPANDGQWHHYAMTFNGSSANLYIDGANVASGALDPKSDVGSTNYIGGTSVYNGVTYYSGLDGVDQVRYFTRALRPYEVEALYTEEYCTPTIVPSEHFNTVLYTGNDADTGYTRQITGVGFQPDFVWIKDRDNGAFEHALFDSVRGAGADKILSSDTTSAEGWTTAAPFSSFDSDGFSVQPRSPYNANNLINKNGEDFVAWNFKAGGAAVTNTDGTITSQVSANTEAGFSVVTWTGGFNGDTIGHGLDNAPDFVIVKARSVVSGWIVYHKSLLSGQILELQNTEAAKSEINIVTNDTTISASWTSTSIDWVAYCFAEVEGFSSFGSYVATSDVPTNVITGFEPAFVMIKAASDLTSGFEDYRSWVMYDNKRNITNNQTTDPLYANRSYQEGLRGNGTAGGGVLDFNFNTNGFSINVGSVEARGFTGEKFIYMAFAADPTTIEPTLEDSFNTVTWTGDNTATRNITGVGFQPDLVWYKKRSGVNQQIWADSVRGATKLIYSSLTAAEQTEPIDGYLSNFITDGFSVSQGTRNRDDVNASGQTYVSWNWKGAELPAINSNGSIPSVVSANPAAGFSIVSYTGAVTGANKTIGHGLSTAPSMVIIKDRDWGVPNWFIWHQGLSGGDYYLTFTTAAQTQNSAVFSAAPTSSVVNLGIDSGVGDRADRYISYCFAEVAGFSKFGSYTGTGASGKSVTTDFEPAFILVKRTDAVSSWRLLDNKRFSGSNKSSLIPNSSAAEQVGYIDVDFNPTNFTINSTNIDFNASGGTYVFMAFANQF